MYRSMGTIIFSVLVLSSTAQASVSGDLDLPPILQQGRSTSESLLPLEERLSTNIPDSSQSFSRNEITSSTHGAPQYPTPQNSVLPLGTVIDLGRTVSQHVQVINTVGITVPQPVPVPVERNVPVPVPQPVDVPVDRPYPVHVHVGVPWKVYKDVPYPVEKRIYVPVSEIHSKVHVHVPYNIYHHKPVPFKVSKRVSVPVPDPILMKKHVPVVVRTHLEVLSHEDLYHHHHHHHSHHNHKQYHKPSW